MQRILVKSEISDEIKKFYSADELIQAILTGNVPPKPIIEGADFSGKDICKSQENQRHEDDYGDFSGKFVNCNFSKANFFCRNVNIEADNCDFSGIRSEYNSFNLKGKGNNFKGISTGSTNFNLDIEDCNFEDVALYKAHITGKVKGGKFDFDDNRTWLGQYEDLTMENVDFGTKSRDPDYFTCDYLKLINPKMNPEVLVAVKEMAPDNIETSTISNNLKGREGR